jgi:hypothetical protein
MFIKRRKHRIDLCSVFNKHRKHRKHRNIEMAYPVMKINIENIESIFVRCLSSFGMSYFDGSMFSIFSMFIKRRKRRIDLCSMFTFITGCAISMFRCCRSFQCLLNAENIESIFVRCLSSLQDLLFRCFDVSIFLMFIKRRKHRIDLCTGFIFITGCAISMFRCFRSFRCSLSAENIESMFVRC